MVQKLNSNRIEWLSTGESFRDKEKQIDPRNYSAIYLEYKQKTVHELFEIISLSKKRNYRLIAVYLLGQNFVPSQEIIDFLRNLVSYENVDIRKEAVWALARLNDSSILPKLLQFLKTSTSDIEKSITAKFLGKIGDERSILPLLKLLTEDNRLSSFSAGIALHNLTDRIGFEMIFSQLRNPSEKIRIQTIWFLCSKAMFSVSKKEQKKIISRLLGALLVEDDKKVKLVLAYGLSSLNVAAGTKELLCFCLSNTINKERQKFFWDEITRFYVYTQKQTSLEIMNKLNNSISAGEQNISKANDAVFSLLKKLENTIKNLDKIFDITS